jgi:metalloprotein, YbeY/UPF0054 family
MQIAIDEDNNIGEALTELMLRACELVFEREEIDAERCEVSLSFVSQEEIKKLNAQYRDKDIATDVLSFPMYESREEFNYALCCNDETPTEAILIGDVVICKEIAEKQAKEIGQSTERELLYLFIHSLLHLLGYDHETVETKRTMRATEEKILRDLGSFGLIHLNRTSKEIDEK